METTFYLPKGRKSVTFFLILLSSYFNTIIAQNNFQHQKDSLLKIIPTLKGTEKLEAYKELYSMLVFKKDINATLSLLREYQRETVFQQNIKEESYVRVRQLILYSNSRELDSLNYYFPKHFDFFEKNGLWNDLYMAWEMKVRINAFTSNRETALDEVKKIYNHARQRNNSYGMAIANAGMGKIFIIMCRHSEAIACFQDAIDLLKVDDTEMPILNDSYYALVNCLLSSEKESEAVPILKKWSDILTEYEKTITNNNIKANNTNIYWFHHYILKTRVYLLLGYEQEADSCFNQVIKRGRTGMDGMILSAKDLTYWYYATKGEYRKALVELDSCLIIHEKLKSYFDLLNTLKSKAWIHYQLEEYQEGYDCMENAYYLSDSLKNVSLAKQLDELRTVYEVDKITAEKDRNRNYFFFTLALCLLLVILLIVWIYHTKQQNKKNRAIVQQIKALQEQEGRTENLVLPEMSPCPDDKTDKLCQEIYNILIKEKAYLNPLLSRDEMISRLGTNKKDFLEAFQKCFKTSFPTCVNDLRLKEALILLEKTDLSMEEISEKAGFGTSRTFYRQFQEKYNMSPTAYKKFSKEENKS